MIRGIEALGNDILTLRTRADQILDEVEEAKDELDTIESSLRKLGCSPDQLAPMSDAINAFLDEVSRPAGGVRFNVPDHPAVHRAIARLYEAVGRNP